jgi:hypothetical protein
MQIQITITYYDYTNSTVIATLVVETSFAFDNPRGIMFRHALLKAVVDGRCHCLKGDDQGCRSQHRRMVVA